MLYGLRPGRCLAQSRENKAAIPSVGRKPGTKLVNPMAKRGRKPAKAEAAQP